MNFQKMMQQAQMMQVKMQELQEQLGGMEVEGVSGGGMVGIRMTCKGEVRKVTIDPSLIAPEEKETLEDLLAAAMNAARASADAKIAGETQKMMEDMGLPSGLQMPF